MAPPKPSSYRGIRRSIYSSELKVAFDRALEQGWTVVRVTKSNHVLLRSPRGDIVGLGPTAAVHNIHNTIANLRRAGLDI